MNLSKEEVPTLEKKENETNVASAENFQKFIYDLFEKNGVFNDLRAYLRGHIVNVLKSVHSGNIPACQKHFTQRLELQYQALNMLIAEYLLNLEFSYSISVFLSEVPLSNMVFEYAQSLFDTCKSGDYSGLKFTDNDVWSVLNYLGLKCDSENASNIMEMYKSGNQSSLLMCIMKGVSLYDKPSEHINKAVTSEDTLSSQSLEEQPVLSSDRIGENNNKTSKCRHCSTCLTCHNRISQIKQKYRKKKERLVKNVIQSELNPTNSTKSLLKNITVVEKNLIDEMFEHLKSVYEAETEMIREEEIKKIKHTLASHDVEFEKRCQEMEESYKKREAELQKSVHHKKRFLWGLAQALRQQHEQMTSAMAAIRQESELLSAKEENLKSQISEAESVFKKRGADMRNEISKELSLLEIQFENIKREKDTISQERLELERIKKDCSNVEMENDLKHHYEILRNEFLVLKNYVANSKSKNNVVEKSTLTDLCGVNAKINMALNNEYNFGCLEDRGSMKTVVNDLKKKNVNFSQIPVSQVYSRSESISGESSEVERTTRLHKLQEDYERLKDLARQQSSHIAQLTRPHTAPEPTSASRPSCCCQHLQALNTSLSANTIAQGAGEHLNLFPIRNSPATVLGPGDELPFVGQPPQRHGENRRDSQLINRWRTLSHAPSGVSNSRPVSPLHRERDINKRPASAGATMESQEPDIQKVSDQNRPENSTFDPVPSSTEQRRLKAAVPVENKRDKSPKSMLKEAKQKLRDNTVRKRSPKREASPGNVLREAKLRLRKLEIEAEAVEQSYRQFKLRHGDMGGNTKGDTGRDRSGDRGSPERVVHRDSGATHSRYHPPDETYSTSPYPIPPVLNQNTIKQDFDKYINDYHNKLNIVESRFNNKNPTTKMAKPIPMTFAEIEQSFHLNDSPREDYLEKTLTEFRKLYNSNKNTHNTQKLERSKSPKTTNPIVSSSSSDHSQRSMKSPIKDKKAELEILKQNITKIYNINDDAGKEEVDFINGLEESASGVALEESERNLLRIEIENIKSDDENNTSETLAGQDLVVVVKSSVDEQEINNRKVVKTEKSENATIIVSKSSPNNIHENSQRNLTISPEQEAQLTRSDVLDAIFQADPNDNVLSSVEIDLDISKNVLVQENIDDYADDFSADVDNYNSRSEYENSPISFPKTDDDNFWD